MFLRLIDNVANEEYVHPLGARELKEAYSVAVELLHGGTEKSTSTSFEYLVVERILHKIFGHVSPEQTVALCHWAIQDLAPANTFFTLIELFSDDNWAELPEAHELYNRCRDEALSRGFRNRITKAIKGLKHTEEYLASQNQIIGNMFKWFRVHSEKLLNLHLSPHRQFPLDTFLCRRSDSLDLLQIKQEMTDFFCEVEVPLIVWPDGSHYSIMAHDSTIESIFLNRCLLDLFSRLWAGGASEWKCPIYDGCQLACKDNSTCVKQPWNQRGDDSNCPYGAAAELIGLTKKATFD